MTRTGKIARLPSEIREQLNCRLQDNEPGSHLLTWLNAIPAVKEMLARDFCSSAITKQNLYEWHIGGFAAWRARRETLAQARELMGEAAELAAATEGKLTDHLATVVAARYASVLAGWNGEVTEELRRKLRALRGLCQDIVELRRGDHSGARLKMEQERLECAREKTDEEVVAHFQCWIKKSVVRDLVRSDELSKEEKQRRMREVFGLPAQPSVGTAAAG
jgi:hypothetical protein